MPLLVSAIVTAYNAAAFIQEALDSVLAQTHPADEIVVVDDGSTDNTAALVATYAARGVRCVTQPNQGAGAARNRGLAETTGEWVAFLDGDDLWLPDKLERQLAYATAHPEVALLSGPKIWWDVARDTRSVKALARPRQPQREILVRNFIGNPSQALLRRAAVQEVGNFDPTVRWGQDWDLWMRLLNHYPFALLPDPLIIYRWHSANLSAGGGWPRLASYWRVAQRGILTFAPPLWRPWLLARAYSLITYDRARLARRQNQPWARQVGYALLALGLFPFEKTGDKLKACVAAALGAERYGKLRAASKGEGE